MDYSIRQGHHEDTRPFSSWLHLGKASIIRRVTFTESCRYELPAYNSLDVNKLFGLSFGLFAVHKNSARFGWYYDPADDTIVLVAYCYVNGILNRGEQMRLPEVARVKIEQEIQCTIKNHGTMGYYSFGVTDKQGRRLGQAINVDCPRSLPWFGLTHSLWFGGALPAPHDIHVVMTKP